MSKDNVSNNAVNSSDSTLQLPTVDNGNSNVILGYGDNQISEGKYILVEQFGNMNFSDINQENNIKRLSLADLSLSHVIGEDGKMHNSSAVNATPAADDAVVLTGNHDESNSDDSQYNVATTVPEAPLPVAGDYNEHEDDSSQ